MDSVKWLRVYKSSATMARHAWRVDKAPAKTHKSRNVCLAALWLAVRCELVKFNMICMAVNLFSKNLLLEGLWYHHINSSFELLKVLVLRRIGFLQLDVAINKYALIIFGRMYLLINYEQFNVPVYFTSYNLYRIIERIWCTWIVTRTFHKWFFITENIFSNTDTFV